MGKPSAFGGEHRRELGVTWQAADRELDTGHEVRAIEMDRARHVRLIDQVLWPEIDDQQVLVAEMRLELIRLHESSANKRSLGSRRHARFLHARGAELELGNLANRIERRVGEHIGGGFGVAKRNEHAAFGNRTVHA